MTGADLEHNYWGTPAVTPERLAAWRRWVDDYAIGCSLRWVEDPAIDDDKALGGAEAVAADWGQIDSQEWLPLGPSLNLVAFARPGVELKGDDRIQYMLATRTAQTSTEPERVAAVAYQLGISTQQAWKYVPNGDSYRGRDRDGAKATALYRYFDENDTLLYIGISQNPTHRDEQHSRNSAWHRLVAHRTVRWFDTSREAHLAEREAIKSERPLFNTAHATDKTRRSALDYLLAKVATGVSA